MAAVDNNELAFLEIVRSNDYRADVSGIVRANTKGVQLTIDDGLMADYRENNLLNGIADKDAAAHVKALEMDASAARSIGSRIIADGQSAGKIVADAKARVGHGNWEWYCQNRMGMHPQAALRLMSEAKAIVLYPKLAEVLEEIPRTALAQIGMAKDMEESKIERIYEAAAEGILDVAKTQDILREGRTRSVKPLPFVKVSPENAALAIEHMGAMISNIEQALADVKVDEAAKHSRFTKWSQAASRNPETDLQKHVRGLMLVAWRMEESLYNPSPLVEFPQDGSPIIEHMTPEQEADQTELEAIMAGTMIEGENFEA